MYSPHQICEYTNANVYNEHKFVIQIAIEGLWDELFRISQIWWITKSQIPKSQVPFWLWFQKPPILQISKELSQKNHNNLQ